MIAGRNKIVFGVALLGVLMSFTLFANGQRGLIKEEYLFLQPGVSTKSDVERRFGSSNTINFSTQAFSANLLISIDYSRGDCSASPWNFPVWTVEEVIMFPKGRKPLKLEDVVLKRSKFAVRSNSDVLTMTEYYNEELGVSIEYDRKLQRIESIRLRPIKELIKQNSCSSD